MRREAVSAPERPGRGAAESQVCQDLENMSQPEDEPGVCVRVCVCGLAAARRGILSQQICRKAEWILHGFFKKTNIFSMQTKIY